MGDDRKRSRSRSRDRNESEPTLFSGGMSAEQIASLPMFAYAGGVSGYFLILALQIHNIFVPTFTFVSSLCLSVNLLHYLLAHTADLLIHPTQRTASCPREDKSRAVCWKHASGYQRNVAASILERRHAEGKSLWST